MVNHKLSGQLFLIFLTVFTGAVFSQINELNSNLKQVNNFEINKHGFYQAGFINSNALYTVSKDNQAEHWLFTVGSETYSLPACEGSVYLRGDFDDSGQTVGILCEDSRVQIWDLKRVKLLSQITRWQNKTDSSPVRVHVSPNGKRAVIGHREKGLLVDVENNKELWELSSDIVQCYCNREIYEIRFSPNGKAVAVVFGGMIFIWDTQVGDLISRFGFSMDNDRKRDYSGATSPILFTDDGMGLVTRSGLGNVKLWNVSNGKFVRSFNKHKMAITALAISPDSKILATGGRDQRIILWDFETGKEISSLHNRKEIREIVFHPTDSRLIGMTSTHLFLWDTNTGQKLDEMMLRRGSRIPQISRDWKNLIFRNDKEKKIDLFEFLEN